MGKTSTTVVREGLQAFADRRVFRNFTEEKRKDGTVRFRFLYLDGNVVHLEFSERNQVLVIRNLLKQVPARMYAELQAFLEKLSDPDLPPYRRVDRGSADARFVKKKGSVSLVFTVKRNRYKYGVDKLVNLMSWVRSHLQGEHQQYLWEVMGEPED